MKHRIVRVLGAAVVALAIFGVWTTVRASWVLTHGGSKAFDGLFDYPIWSVGHFLSALVFIVILPFQLWPRVRNRYRRLHRIAGWIAVVCGLSFAVTGLTLPFVMTARPFGERVFMTLVSVFFALVLVKGVTAARRGDLVTHRRWMLRVSAAALGPLTQRAIFPILAAAGIDSMPRFWDLFVTALWLSLAINLLTVEWWIDRSAAPSI
jgi:uncharacterized membrane protein